MNGARIPYWQALFIVVVVATLMCVGCATSPAAVAAAAEEDEPTILIRPMCDGGGNFRGLVIATMKPGVWKAEFDPTAACEAGI